MSEHDLSTTSASAEETSIVSRDEAQLRGRKLFALGSLAAGALLVYYAVTAQVDDPLHLYQGLLMVLLAVLPSLLWARRGGENLPAFEVVILMTANTYAFPLLNGHVQLNNYDSSTITTTANLVLLYQIIAISAYLLVKGRPIRSAAFQKEVLTRDLQKYVGYGLLLSTGYTLVSIYYGNLIPSEINTVLRAVCMGIGLVTTFAQSRRWGHGLLTRQEKTTLVVLVSAQAVMQFSTLFLVQGISIILVGLVGFVSGAKRIPLAATLIVFGVAAILHNGKSTMRARYWTATGGQHSLEVQQLPAFFSEWIQAGLSGADEQGAEREMTKKLLDRTSLFHMLCMVTDLTPDRLPFLNGETYAQVPGQFVPRFFWPNKPHAHISTDTLAIYYGLQDETTVRNATIGFGLVAEAYANFGFFGVGTLAFILGAFYKRVHTATAESPLLSYPGLFVIILMAWSFQTEATMAVWLGSMSQACIGVLGVPFLIRNLAG